MPTESDLRDLLRAPEPADGSPIDLDAVLRRARARRRPRAIAASAVGALALVGVLTPAVLIGMPRPAQEVAMVAEDSGGASADTGAAPLSALKIDACGVPLAAVDADDALVLEMSPVSGDAGLPPTVEVTLRNVGDTAIEGEVGLPLVTLATVNGTVIAAAAVDSSARTIDLAPGAATTFDAAVPTISCDPDDPEIAGPVAAGDYLIRAVLHVRTVSADGTVVERVVGGPTVALTLR